jgi:hypothetical protein
MITTKPESFKPPVPTPGTLIIQFTPTRIHPWYLVRIRQCLVCRAIQQNYFISISDNFDLCGACLKSWEYFQRHPTKRSLFFSRESTTSLTYQKLDLDNILESHAIPAGSVKIIFFWTRSSTLGIDPLLASFSFDFVLKYKSKRYIDTGFRVLAGCGPTYIVPDRYYKAGQSDASLVSSFRHKDHPSWNNLCLDVNVALEARPRVTSNILANRMDDLSTCAFHLRVALSRFDYPKRAFLVIRMLAKNPDRFGTCPI